MFRYYAQLQRFDSEHVIVAEGDDLAVICGAATDLYCSLIPTILTTGSAAIDRLAREEARDRVPSDPQTSPNFRAGYWQDQLVGERPWISDKLRAQEWNVSVYDRTPDDRTPEDGRYPELVFSIGATLEDPPRP